MRNIFLFIRQFFNLFLFIALLGISLVILSNYSKTYEAFLGSQAGEVTGWFDKKYNGIEGYFYLKRTNDSLAKDNVRLYNLLRQSFDSPDTAHTIKIDSLVRDTVGRIRKFRFMDAKVINNSVNEENNYITLYRGSKQGVAKDMGVIGPDGIVGRVIMVSDNYSRVMSLLNRNSKVSAMLKNAQYTGIVDWDGKDPQYVTLRGIPKSIKVNKGDTVLTSNLSGSFPSGIMIGTVAALTPDPASNFYLLQLKTATNFFTLQYAYLVNNLLWEEQQQLEAKTPQAQ